MEEINFNDFKWIASYYWNRKDKKVYIVSLVQDKDIPEEVKEYFKKHQEDENPIAGKE